MIELHLISKYHTLLSGIALQFLLPVFFRLIYLPIRLGMANADGDQDMIVYAFTKKGRIECTNYRTVSLPTGNEIPVFVKNNFGNFYSNLFQHQWDKEGKSVAMLEYAWDVSPKNFVKCDPCVATAPSPQDLVQAGVWWLNNSDAFDDEEEYSANVYFTRLHVRYNRKYFPQDLVFQVTPNTENYQARYVVRHPAQGSFECEAGKQYLKELKERRQNEIEMLSYLTGKGYSDWDVVLDKSEKNIPLIASYDSIGNSEKDQREAGKNFVFALVGLAGIISLVGLTRRKG